MSLYTLNNVKHGKIACEADPMKVGEGFSVARYATGVANELLWALEGLVGR